MRKGENDSVSQRKGRTDEEREKESYAKEREIESDERD